MTTNNISDRLNLTNDMYNYITPVNRLKMGNMITEKMKNEGCNPRRLFYRVAGNNANFKVREIISTTPLRFKNKNGKTVKGIREIGKGLEGTVYLGCIDKECKKHLAIKHGLTKDVSFEYKITKEIHNWSPHIVTPYALSKPCSNKKSYYYSEYQSGGDLLKWLGANYIHLKPIQIKVLVFQIIYTLYRIQQMDPGFRHNDLHSGNVFVNDKFTARGDMRYVVNQVEFTVPNVGVNALVADFGYANSTKNKNPIFPDPRLRNAHGIDPDNNSMYDVHLFLNSIWLMSSGKPVMYGVKRFIEDVLPPAYLGRTSTKIIDFRLRFDVSHEKLPNLQEILYRPYFMTAFMSGPKNTITPNSPTIRKKGRNLKKMSKINEGNERPSPKRYSRQNMLKLRPLAQNHTFINFGPNLSRACLPTMKASNIARFVTTNGTIASKKELTQIFVPGKKVPSKVRLCQLLQTFRKGRSLLKKGPPEPKAQTPPKPKAQTPPKPKAQIPPKPKMRRPPSQLMSFGNKNKITRPTRFVVPVQGRIILDSNERREAKFLAGKMADENTNLQKIENFEAREEKALQMAINIIKERKRQRLKNEKRQKQILKNTGLNSNSNSNNNSEPAPKPLPPPKAAPINARRMIAEGKKPMVAVRKPGQWYEPQKVGVKTGKRAIILSNSLPLKAPMTERGIFSVNTKDRLKIGNKLCASHGKDEIQKYLRNSGVVIAKKMTKEEMCQALKKNIFK
jgi:hypothetical protein